MSFLGLRKWPTPARLSPLLLGFRLLTYLRTNQVLKPMWPFIVASGLTFYLVSKAQDMGVKSEAYRNDPRNPYAAQIAKQAHH
ncbi:hypothetical protein BN946_scf184843.g17 [Trametes cinnabarina]|uniref:ATP synthase subunit J, mitochondrial n=1 Tax=Pycnoporus cinnabarinus TaxID=5643 RepID=A0A060SD82_PYCCI|nr:hypothetical protein BN946_scf184843.g17 [Trametes cinnabarina]